MLLLILLLSITRKPELLGSLWIQCWSVPSSQWIHVQNRDSKICRSSWASVLLGLMRFYASCRQVIIIFYQQWRVLSYATLCLFCKCAIQKQTDDDTCTKCEVWQTVEIALDGVYNWKVVHTENHVANVKKKSCWTSFFVHF